MPVAATRAETALVVYLNESVADHEVPDSTEFAAELTTEPVPVAVAAVRALVTVKLVAVAVANVAEARLNPASAKPVIATA